MQDAARDDAYAPTTSRDEAQTLSDKERSGRFNVASDDRRRWDSVRNDEHDSSREQWLRSGGDPRGLGHRLHL